MVKPLEHIRKYPKLAKQMIGLTLPQLEQLIRKASALYNNAKANQQKHSILF